MNIHRETMAGIKKHIRLWLNRHQHPSDESKSRFMSQTNSFRVDEPKYLSITFSELSAKWRGVIQFRNKQSTLLKYDYLLEKHILPSLGNYSLDSLNTAILQQYVNEKLTSGRLDGKGGLASSYVHSIIVLINSILEFGYQEQLCSSLKIRRMLPVRSNYQPKTLSKNDQKELEQYLFSHFTQTNIGILLALYAGLRIGEVCAISWDNINMEDKIISVRYTVVRTKTAKGQNRYTLDIPKTKTSVRDIPITEKLFFALKAIPEKRKGYYLLSNSTTFMPPPALEYRYHKTLRSAGVEDINFHALRHTFATRCIESGMDDKSLSEILGHSNVSITLGTYVHSSMELKKEHMHKLSVSPADK